MSRLHVGAYLLIHVKSGRIYVGSGRDVWERRSHHIGQLQRGRHHNAELQRLYDEDDELNFEPTLTADREAAYDLEQDFLNQAFAKGIALNGSRHARATGTGRVHTAEERALRSQLMRGRFFSEDHRQRLSVALKGKAKSPEHIANNARARHRPVVVDGVMYESVSDCAEKLGVPIPTVSRRVNSDSPRFAGWLKAET